jgi:hypothetical protein
VQYEDFEYALDEYFMHRKSAEVLCAHDEAKLCAQLEAKKRRLWDEINEDSTDNTSAEPKA